MPNGEKGSTGVLVALGAAALAGVAYVVFRGKTSGKAPGDILKVTYRFIHKGSGGIYEIGTGIAPVPKSLLGGPAFGYNAIQAWMYENIEVKAHSVETPHEVDLEFKWPNVSPGTYDALAYIQKLGGSHDPGGTGYIITDGWKDDALIGR